LERFDLGLVDRFTLGDFVWNDKNGNGIQDANEQGIANVLLAIENDQRKIIATATSDVDGRFEFESFRDRLTALQAVTIVVRPPSNTYRVTTADVGSDRSIDSSGALIDGQIEFGAVLPRWSVDDASFDVGLRQPITLGDRVWLDVDGNGLQSSDEPGIADVLLSLYRNNDQSLIGTTTTDNDGYYTFSGTAYDIEANTQYAIIVQQQSNRRASPNNVGNDNLVDSNAQLIFDELIILFDS
jgi:serine-aspartate repeat-containing protein C/D/E